MYLRIDESFFDDPKIINLCGLLQDRNAGMYVLRLWAWEKRWAMEGGLTDMTPFAIEDIAGYRCLDGKCYEALIASRVLAVVGSSYAIALTSIDAPVSSKSDYGSRWKQIRDEIVARDGSCVECHATDRLEVHHVVPLRVFNGNIDAANDAANLKTLCKRCHASADAAYRAMEASS